VKQDPGPGIPAVDIWMSVYICFLPGSCAGSILLTLEWWLRPLIDSFFVQKRAPLDLKSTLLASILREKARFCAKIDLFFVDAGPCFPVKNRNFRKGRLGYAGLPEFS
jgi:hypothetical protein